MRTFKKDELRFIGLYRGIEQYEVLDDMSLVLLKLGDDYYLSQASDINAYNTNILVRIGNFYGSEGIKALGEKVEVIK